MYRPQLKQRILSYSLFPSTILRVHRLEERGFICPHALFAGALIQTYVNQNIRISKMVLKKGESITVHRKMDSRRKQNVNKSG